ncbi:sigma-54 factor interaction domain-containing protein, partial [bacterium]|nr:sigma-54 factor interaction domain-containing protein [bacterium]
VGQDPRMRQVFDVIHRVADTKATILVTGESGTGKSMIARAIHRRSQRREGPFVEVACGAMPESLLESELFGHVAGAFTGAVGDKQGKFLQADGGTIFLDEIGTASQSMQVKLLRVLQDFEFEPVGGTKTYHINTRVVLATNENLEKAVAEGRFRQDLFYRINVINVELPSLRDRREDVALL